MFWKRLLLTVIAGSGALAAQAAPPTPDFTPSGFPAYIRALNQSTDPQAIAIRRQIADGPATLARERAAAQSAGIPLTANQLQRPLPPSGQNAAPLYQQLADLRRQKPLNLPLYAQSLTAGVAYTPEQLAAVQKIVDSRRDVFDLLHRAADTPQCVFLRDWSQGAAVLFPEFAGLREGARELNTESFLLARQGRYAEAIADQSRGFRVAQHAASDPTLIAYLVAVAIDSITLSGMKNILYQAGPDAVVDSQVSQAVAANRLTLSVKYALSGDAALYLITMGDTEKMDLTSLSGELSSGPVKAQTLTPDDLRFIRNLVSAVEAQYLSDVIPVVAVADQTGPARRAAFAASSAESAVKDSQNPVTMMSSIGILSFDPAEKGDFVHAQEQVTMAAASVLAAKARTGAFPDALPGAFTDPFTGKPLGYRREGDGGFVVYSVGADGKFDGGKPGDYKFTPPQAFFRYPGPPPQPVPLDMLK